MSVWRSWKSFRMGSVMTNTAPRHCSRRWSPQAGSDGNRGRGSMLTATEQREVVELAREFAKEKIEPFAAEWDRTSHFPREVIDELGRLGFLGMTTPEEYDGMGLDTVTYLLALEELAAADASVAVSVGLHNAIPITLLVRHGSAAQRERWLKPLARGERLAGFALSEPEAGAGAPGPRGPAGRRRGPGGAERGQGG